MLSYLSYSFFFVTRIFPFLVHHIFLHLVFLTAPCLPPFLFIVFFFILCLHKLLALPSFLCVLFVFIFVIIVPPFLFIIFVFVLCLQELPVPPFDSPCLSSFFMLQEPFPLPICCFRLCLLFIGAPSPPPFPIHLCRNSFPLIICYVHIFLLLIFPYSWPFPLFCLSCLFSFCAYMSSYRPPPQNDHVHFHLCCNFFTFLVDNICCCLVLARAPNLPFFLHHIHPLIMFIGTFKTPLLHLIPLILILQVAIFVLLVLIFIALFFGHNPPAPPLFLTYHLFVWGCCNMLQHVLLLVVEPWPLV